MWLCIAHEIRRRDVERWDGEQVSRGKALHSVQRTRSSLPLMLGVFLFFFSRVSCPSYVCVCFAVEVCWKVCLLESLLNQTKVEQGVLWEHFSFQMKSDENTPVITCESSTWSWKHRCVCVCVCVCHLFICLPYSESRSLNHKCHLPTTTSLSVPDMFHKCWCIKRHGAFVFTRTVMNPLSTSGCYLFTRNTTESINGGKAASSGNILSPSLIETVT